MTQASHVLAALLLVPAVSIADDAQLLATIGAAVQPGRAMHHMRRVWTTDRWFTFPKFHQTAVYLRTAMQNAGLERVEIVKAPADGKTQYGWWTMPLAWDAKSARLEIVEPAVPAAHRVLADYRKVPTSLCMWSGPTPADGITAEVSEGAEDVRGKFVLTARNPANDKWKFVKAGAIAVINAFSENPALRDDRQWINAWGDKGWAFNQGDTPLPCFSITPRQAEFLRDLMKQGRVRLRATVDARYYADSYPYVTGVIRGSGSGEEVLTLGHTSEQGAHDNATGVAAMLESMTTLNGLIRSGRLPRPRRTIRMLAMGELYGSMHYVASNPERIRRTVAAMCVDTPAAAYEQPGTEYTWHLNPRVVRSYVDDYIQRLAGSYFQSVNRPWRHKQFMPGTDTFLADPMIGVPTVWPYSGTGVHSHHMSADTPKTVDRRSLRDLVVMNAAFLYHMASTDIPPAAPLAALPPPHSPAGEGSRMIVRRKRFGTITLDDLPVDRREGHPSGAWSLPHIIALYWCDGRRTIEEVIRRTEDELGPQKVDFVSYFRFLARKGYVDIAELPR